jgi:hypothetical protein
MGGASTQQRSEVLERPALSSGVRELLAAPESVLTREDKLRFLNLWKSCRWSSDAMVTFLKEVLDSSKLTSEEKRRVCVEGVAQSAHTADELAMMELALDMALNRLAPAKAAALRTDLGRG